MTAAAGAPLPGKARSDEPAERKRERELSWFRVRLALRSAIPVDSAAQADAGRLAWSAVLAALPLTVSLAAPVSALGKAGVLGLACAALPGLTATAWTASRLYDSRTHAARALHQVGAEQRSASVMAAVRVVIFAGSGALVGGVCMILIHVPLSRLLPRHSPLRPMLTADGIAWASALIATIILMVLGALVASSPAWRRFDAQLRTARASVRAGLRAVPIRVRREARQPR